MSVDAGAVSRGLGFRYELLYADDEPRPVGVTFTQIPVLVPCKRPSGVWLGRPLYLGGSCSSHSDCRETAIEAERHEILTAFTRGEPVRAKSRRTGKGPAKRPSDRSYLRV